MFAPTVAARSQDPAPNSDWSRINLPFHPVSMASDGSVLWVCGADEMLARSDDGGATWQVKHQKPGADVLLTVGILDDKTVYAAGTNGDMIWSGDGGETWTAWQGGAERIVGMAFADNLHGIRQTLSGAQITSDGGKTWAAIPAMSTDSAVSPFSNVLGIAALDSTHFALLLNKPQGENIFLSTKDGGATWTPLHLDDTYAGDLFARDGKYWALGMEIVNRQKRGGYSVPLVLSSTDGLAWQHGAKSPTEFEGSCTAQGCVLYDGAIVDLYGATPRYIAFPATGMLAVKWAMAKGSVCTIGSALSCAKTTPVDKPPARPEIDRPMTIGPGHNLYNAPPDCLICPLDSFFLDKSLLGKIRVMGGGVGEPLHEMMVPGLQAALDVRFIVQSDGSVGDVQIDGAPRKEIESRLAADIAGWLFDPPPPGTPAENRNRELEILVNCTAFPDNHAATCSAMIPRSN